MYVAFEHSSVNTCPVYGFTFRTRNQEDDPLRWHLDRERAYRQRAQETPTSRIPRRGQLASLLDGIVRSPSR